MVMMMAATGGAALRVFKAPGLVFVTTDFTLHEAKTRVSRLIARYGLNPNDVAEALAALPLSVRARDEYESHIAIADSYIGRRDPNDVALLALALKLEIPVWSHDPDFNDAPVERFTTGQLLNELGV